MRLFETLFSFENQKVLLRICEIIGRVKNIFLIAMHGIILLDLSALDYRKSLLVIVVIFLTCLWCLVTGVYCGFNVCLSCGNCLLD